MRAILRSVVGMVLRHPLILLALGAWWIWPSSSDRDREVGTQRAAVLSDGFAVLEGIERKRVYELDDDGSRRRVVTIHGLPADTRLVGARPGPALVWKNGRKLALALVDRLDRPEQFGKHVHHLCEQVATNDRRFGVAWTEQDGEVWFVHGPSTASLETAQTFEPTKQPDYCAIASAHDKIALLWRAGDRMMMTRCGKSCPGVQAKIAIERGHAILGFGCTGDACVIVTRHDRTSYAMWVTPKGKVEWKKPLPSADADTTVSVVGIGSQIAIAYSLGPEPVVRVADRGGTLAAIWQGGGDPDTVPSLASAGDRLLVAFERDGQLGTAVLKP
jgi:hypothetical protein